VTAWKLVSSRFPAIAAACLIVLCACVMLGWGLGARGLMRAGSELQPMSFTTAVCLLLAGCALLARSTGWPAHRNATAATGLGIAVLAAQALVQQHVFGSTDGDLLLARLLGRSGNAMSTSTAVALVAVCAALIASARVRGKPMAIFVEALTAAVGIASAAVIAGWLIDASLLYSPYIFEHEAIHTALGLVMLSCGLWLIWERQPWFWWPTLSREDDRIAFHGAAILGAIALIAGIASYATLQRRVQSGVLDDIGVDLRERKEQILDTLAIHDRAPRLLSERGALLRYLGSAHPDARDFDDVRVTNRSLISSGFSAIAYQDRSGAVIEREGQFVETPELVVALARDSESYLMWTSRGFVIRHILPVRSGGKLLGVQRTEQLLPVLNRIVQSKLDLGDSEEIVICGRRRPAMLDCFPSQLHAQVRHFTEHMENGEPRPAALGASGASGVTITRNDTGLEAFEAYGPIGGSGLGLLVKVEAADVLRPLREQLHVVVVLLAFVVAAGAALLRWKLRPLATRLVEAQREAQERNAELVDAVEAKDRFLATMSHELRTPLNAIIGFTGMLLLKLPGPLNTEQERQLGTVRSSARYLLSLINDLLDLAKIEAGKVHPDIEPVACEQLVHEVVESLRPLAEAKGLHLHTDIPEAGVTVNSDRRMLSQILLNLAANAIKFTESGRVAIRLRQEEHRIEVSVADTGPGIALEDQSKLFSTFTQLDSHTSRRHEGTGLGLHLSRRLAQILGGRITLASVVGSGSTFTLVLEES
jgi:signal transduction histidine kinase